MGAGTSRLTARSWILLDSKSSLVTLQHGQTSGQRIITIGDKEVINTSKAVDFGSEHKFTHSDQKIVIKITCTKSTYSYTLTCDGKLLECRPVAYDVEINIYRTCRELESCVSTIWKLDDNNLFCHLRHGLQSGKRSLWCGGEQMFMERKVSERSRCISRNATDIMATSTTKLTHPNILARARLRRSTPAQHTHFYTKQPSITA